MRKRFAQGVTSVKRNKLCRNNERVPTNTLILNFSIPTLPDSVKAGYLRISVAPYIINPLRCFNCQKFGHGQNAYYGRLSFTEARKLVEASRPAATGKPYAAMVKVSTTSVAIQTDLTWPNGVDTYKKNG